MTNTESSALPNRIRELRIEKKITQLQLSIILNVTQETISAYESRHHLPSVHSLLKMSEAFDASIDYIMGRSPVRYPTSHSTARIDVRKQELLNCYQLLDHRHKSLLLAYGKGLLDSKLS